MPQSLLSSGDLIEVSNALTILQEAFMHTDVDASGVATLSQLCHKFAASQGFRDTDGLRAIFADVDIKGKGCVDFGQFSVRNRGEKG